MLRLFGKSEDATVMNRSVDKLSCRVQFGPALDNCRSDALEFMPQPGSAGLVCPVLSYLVSWQRFTSRTDVGVFRLWWAQCIAPYRAK